MTAKANQDAIIRQLRTLFDRRDRIAAQLAAHDAKVNAMIRRLCDSQGIAFMRVEAARQLVAGQEEAA